MDYSTHGIKDTSNLLQINMTYKEQGTGFTSRDELPSRSYYNETFNNIVDKVYS